MLKALRKQHLRRPKRKKRTRPQRQLLLVTMSTDSVDDPDALKEIQDMILTIRYAVIVISTLPIMCLYPFLQKYFVQGVMIGSLKG